MARLCNNCGAPLSDDARFCAECGTPVPADVTEETAAPETPETTEAPVAPEAPAAPETPEAPAAAAPEAPEAPAAAPETPWASQPGAVAAPPKPKKPRPKWVLPVIIAVVVVGVGFLAAWQILGHMFGPEKAMEHFIDALEAGDAEALVASAVCADEDVTLTAENTAPLLKLYEEDRGFRDRVEQLLEDDLERIEDEDDPDDRQLFSLKGESRFLHTAYTVAIGTCSADISANLVGPAQIEGGTEVRMAQDDDDGEGGWATGWSALLGPDCDLTHWCTGTARDLLPGIYTVSGTVTTSFGDTFTASTELRVTDRSGASAGLEYDCQTLEVYNDNGIDAEIYIGGEVYGVVEANSSYLIAPILPGTPVEVRADVGGDEPIVLTCTAEECDGYFNAAFELCELEIYNDYDAPLTVYKGSEVIAEVEPDSTYTVENLPKGTELTISLYSDILEDVTVTCEERYDYIYPEFQLPANTLAEIDAMARDYLALCIDSFNAGSDAAFTDGTIQESGLSRDLASILQSTREYTFEDYGFTMTVQVNLSTELAHSEDSVSLWTDSDGLLHVSVDYEAELEMLAHSIYEDPEIEPTDQTDTESIACEFEVCYTGGAWEIVDVN